MDIIKELRETVGKELYKFRTTGGLGLGWSWDQLPVVQKRRYYRRADEIIKMCLEFKGWS